MKSFVSNCVRSSIIPLVTVAVDQLTKLLIVESLAPGEIIPIVPRIFNLTLTFNKGAAFGVFSGLPDGVREVVLALTTIIAFAVILYFMRTEYGNTRMARISFLLIIGGALGNIIDRARLGYVIDFLDVYYGQYHWPAFNVADSCICIGVALLIASPYKKPQTA